MADVRKHHSADFKRKVALEAIRQQKTMNQITAEYGVHASQITNWKKQALEGINQAFVVSRKSVETDRQVEIDQLHNPLPEGKGRLSLSPLPFGRGGGGEGHLSRVKNQMQAGICVLVKS